MQYRLLLVLAPLAFASPLVFTPTHHAPSTSLSALADLRSDVADLTLGELTSLVHAHTSDPLALYKSLVSVAEAESQDEPRLLRLFGEREPFWTTEGEKFRLMAQRVGFMDLTRWEGMSMKSGKVEGEGAWPRLIHQKQVKDVLPHLSAHNMYDTLEKFTSFYDRYYKSPNGAASSHWLYLQILDIVAKAPAHVPLSVRKFTHGFAQSSIIARFEAPFTNASDEVVVLGAHLDSVNHEFPLLPAPGADDDGSGTVTILEAFRALVERGFTPRTPVEFHWYAAEEPGLLGSLDIVKDYLGRSISVKAMLQFDTIAFNKVGREPTITLIDNETTDSLTKWAVTLAEEYSEIKVQVASLFPHAGSDHMSWREAGFPVAFATEDDPYLGYDPYVHTAADRMNLPNDEFSFEHALEFAKLAAGFAIELGGWEL